MNQTMQNSTLHIVYPSNVDSSYELQAMARIIMDHMKIKEVQKRFYFCFIALKPLTVWITTDCGKFLKKREYQTILPASYEICM